MPSVPVCSLAGGDDPRADLEEVRTLAKMARALGWSSPCIATVLDIRYGIPAEDGLDLMVLTAGEAADLNRYLMELSHEWIGNVVQ